MSILPKSMPQASVPPAGEPARLERSDLISPKPIDELTDIELLQAVYGEVLSDDLRKTMRDRLRLMERQLSAESFDIDTTAPPYEVPCPSCLAYALAPCMTEPRPSPKKPFPSTARVLDGHHPERMKWWEENPSIRVKVMR